MPCNCCGKKSKQASDDNDEEVDCPPGEKYSCCGVDSAYTSLSDPENNPQKINCNYVRNLENEFECLQKAFLSLTTHFARMQFRLRQIMQAAPEERYGLLCDLERIAFEGVDEKNTLDELPRIQRDIRCMGDVRHKVNTIINKLRCQLVTLSEAPEIQTIDSGEDVPSKGKSRRSGEIESKQSKTGSERNLKSQGSKSSTRSKGGLCAQPSYTRSKGW